RRAGRRWRRMTKLWSPPAASALRPIDGRPRTSQPVSFLISQSKDILLVHGRPPCPPHRPLFPMIAQPEFLAVQSTSPRRHRLDVVRRELSMAAIRVRSCLIHLPLAVVVLIASSSAPCAAADLFRDDFSHFPPGWLTRPVGQLNAAIQEYHYLPHRGVP